MNVRTNLRQTASEALSALSQQAEQHCVTVFGKSPQWVVAAPGRVNVIGEHTDYNDGFVLPMAIERYVVIAACPHTAGDEGVAEFHSIDLADSFEISLSKPLESQARHWSGYVKGVIAGFLDRGYNIPSLRAVIQSSVPLGGGLSSSAALEVATATLLEAASGTSLESTEKALICQHAEHQFTGVPCGIMDQFSSIFGQEDALMLLDCRSLQIQSVPFTAPDVTALITNSNVKHELVRGEYAERRQQSEAAAKALGVSTLRDATLATLEAASDQLDEIIYRRARHVITENSRTLQAADAIREGHWSIAGDFMYASHASLRNDYEVSCDELDVLVETAREIGVKGGVFGSRMTGAGFGGCTLSLVKTDSIGTVKETIRSRYTKETGIEPHIFTSRPARGAHVIRG